MLILLLLDPLYLSVIYRFVGGDDVNVGSCDFNRNDSLVVGFKIRLQVPNRYIASRRTCGGLTDSAPDLYEQQKAMSMVRMLKKSVSLQRRFLLKFCLTGFAKFRGTT